jgi:hypothetical protein
MPFSIDEIFPTYRTGLSNIGFFFGAGSSKEAGYPVGWELTKNVIGKLSPIEKEELTRFLTKKGIPFLFEDGIPDIESLSDLIIKDRIATQNPVLESLEKSIKKGIIEEIDSVTNPNLEHHIRFLQILKKLIQNRPETIWIFTTNYDLAFELAAMEARIPIYNGFEGISGRYFDIDRLGLKYGTVLDPRRFREHPEPCIKLIKLHGSISWYQNKGQVLELFNGHPHQDSSDRLLILPKREKIFESMGDPYDKLFRLAHRVIGTECKYLISLGYSFRDQHINEQLIIPRLRERSIRLFSLLGDTTQQLEELKTFPTVSYLSKYSFFKNGQAGVGDYDLWKFSAFVNFLNS